MRCSRFLLATVVGLAAACSAEGGDPLGAGNGNGNGNGPSGNRDGGSGSNNYFPDALAPGSGGANGGGPTAMNNCGLKKYDLKRLPADLLLVQDRSGSMLQSAGANMNQNRWQALTGALDAVVMKTQASVNWGLKLYPRPSSSCGVSDGVDLAPMTNAYERIAQLIDSRAAARNGGTPTRVAMEAATGFLKESKTPNPKYILLATDGLPNCLNGDGSDRGADQDGAVKSVADAVAAGFPTFVVGIAIDDATQMTLNRMADAGGKPRKDATIRFYPATSQEELTTALSSIAGQVASCTFTLDQQPPSPQDVAVNVGGMRIALDPANGWAYGAGMRSIELRGSTCDKVKALPETTPVEILFGCPGMAIP